MRRANRIPNLGGRRAVVLHKPHDNAAALLRQLLAIGLHAESAWPDLPADANQADVLFFDADMASDAQFPWTPGEAPMPLVAVIGSEAPGRIEWALSHRADAHLTKPIGGAGVYSALLIARQKFDERLASLAEVEALRAQVAERRTLVRALVTLMGSGLGEDEAFDTLRRRATEERVTIEMAAARLLAAAPARRRIG